MGLTFLELLDAGLCHPECLLAPPTSKCDCRCNGFCHGELTGYVNRQATRTSSEFPGYRDLEIGREFRRLRSMDPEGEWMRDMREALGA